MEVRTKLSLLFDVDHEGPRIVHTMHFYVTSPPY